MPLFENRMLRRVFGPKWECVAGDWRRIRVEELVNTLMKLGVP
jgi:hypothetical protein